MTNADQRSYFERRAAQELTAAEQAASPHAAHLHRELAGHYLELARGGKASPEEAPGPGEPGILSNGFRIVG